MFWVSFYAGQECNPKLDHQISFSQPEFAAREQNKEDSGDETEDDEEVIEGFDLAGLKDDATA